jgi:hypothetical protein
MGRDGFGRLVGVAILFAGLSSTVAPAASLAMEIRRSGFSSQHRQIVAQSDSLPPIYFGRWIPLGLTNKADVCAKGQEGSIGFPIDLAKNGFTAPGIKCAINWVHKSKEFAGTVQVLLLCKQEGSSTHQSEEVWILGETQIWMRLQVKSSISTLLERCQ